VTYQVILLKDNIPIVNTAQVSISDAASKKVFNLNIIPNEEQFIQIESDFPSGYWKIEANYGDKSVKRFFSVGAREEVEFSIENDNLIIRNAGNTRYTKEVQILIGDQVVKQMQSIDVGSFKQIKLVAPNGEYDVEVTDGTTTMSKKNVYLAGTGNVVGVIDKELLESTPALGSVRESPDSGVSQKNATLPIIFIIGVLAISILLTIERVMKRRVSKN